MHPYLPYEGSTYASEIDYVIWLVGVLVGFWFFAALGMFFWLCWRYRDKPGRKKAEYITGDEPHLKRWVSWPHILIILCDLLIIWAAVQVWVSVKQTLPEEHSTNGSAPVPIRIISQQWAWTFVHAGEDNRLDTEDDIAMVDEMHIRSDRVYHYELLSRDVLHSFSVPIFRLKQDAVPGRVIRGWFEPIRTGSYDIQCVEMCGIGHGIMGARVTIESPEEHTAWMARHTPTRFLALSE